MPKYNVIDLIKFFIHCLYYSILGHIIFKYCLLDNWNSGFDINTAVGLWPHLVR
jgi:hypothetical protein